MAGRGGCGSERRGPGEITCRQGLARDEPADRVRERRIRCAVDPAGGVGRNDQGCLRDRECAGLEVRNIEEVIGVGERHRALRDRDRVGPHFTHGVDLRGQLWGHPSAPDRDHWRRSGCRARLPSPGPSPRIAGWACQRIGSTSWALTISRAGLTVRRAGVVTERVVSRRQRSLAGR